MTTEQQILWLSWFRYPDCKELFETITGDHFHTDELGKIYEMIRTRQMSYNNDELEKVLYTLDKVGVLSAPDIYIPIFPEKLKEALVEEWKKTKGNQLLNKAHEALTRGGDYRKVLKEFDKLETEHKKIQSTLKDHFEAIAEDYLTGKTKGIPTGIEGIDAITQQLKKGHWWVIAAATSFGKTTLTLQIAKHVLFQGGKVDFISLEMSARQLLERITWIEAAQRGIRFEKAISRLIDLPLTVTENLRKVDDIRAHLEQSNADLVIVDYIQLIRGGKDYYDEATMASNMFQEMAIKKMIPIITLSQVTKESYKSGMNHDIDLKGSGAIGESADVVMEIYRHKDNEPDISEVNLFVKKNRHGQTATCKVSFDRKKGIFVY